MLISFEGLDQSGKSTIIRKLVVYLTDHKIDSFVTKEPGVLSKEFRDLMLFSIPQFRNVSRAKVDSLIFGLDRLIDFEKNIEPNLKAKKIVIVDRFIDSSIVYQTLAVNDGFNFDDAVYFQSMLIKKQYPDVTFIIDIPAVESTRRLKSMNIEPDRFENDSKEFKNRLREGYLSLPKKFPTRKFIVINGDQPIDNVFQDVLVKFLKIYKESEWA